MGMPVATTFSAAAPRATSRALVSSVGNAIKIHARFHPERVRFEIGDDADGQRTRRASLSRACAEDFERQIMRAQHHVRFELL